MKSNFSKLTSALSDGICHAEQLIALLVEQPMIVAKIRPRHVPVKILGLQVKREHVREKVPQALTPLLDSFLVQLCVDSILLLRSMLIRNRSCLHSLFPFDPYPRMR